MPLSTRGQWLCRPDENTNPLINTSLQRGVVPPCETSTVSTVWSPVAVSFPKSSFFKAFQRLSKERFLRTYSVQIHAGPGESKPVKPSPTKSNHTPPLKTCETKSGQIRVNPINFLPASLLPTSPEVALPNLQP